MKSAESARASMDAPPAPMVKGLPLVGSLPAVVMGQYRFLEQAFATEGPIFQLDLGVTSALIVGDVDAAEAVFVSRAKNYDKGGDFWDGGRELMGYGLTSSEGELWRRQRKLMQPSFQREVVESYRPMIDETIRAAIDAVPADTPVDFASFCDELLSLMTVRILLGSDVALPVIEKMRDAMSVLLGTMLTGMVLRKLPRWLPRPGRARLEEARKSFNDDLLDLIAQSRRRGRGNDLLSALIHATDELGTMSDQQLRDEAIVIFGAGYETTGASLAWTLWLLARHPRVLADLQREIDAKAGEKTLLNACIREGLRLYPPGAMVPRRTVEDDVLGGFAVPAETTVLVAPWLIHRDPRLWPRPYEFDPSRFMPAEPAPERPRLAWIPFGAGQRLCIGMALALLELERAIELLLERFTPVVAGSGPKPEPRMSTTVKSSGPILLSLRPRER